VEAEGAQVVLALGQDRAESISRLGRHLGSGLALLADRLDQHFWRFLA
jgi:hypothetical protein